MPSMTVDVKPLRELSRRLNSPMVRSRLESIAGEKGVIAIVIQAIADNFDKEGPGWAPLKGETLRRTVGSKVLKVAKQRAAYDMGVLKFDSRKGNHKINKKELKGAMAEFHERTGKHLVKMEAEIRRANKSGANIEPSRMILQRTGLLKKTVTTVGYSGTSGKASGANVYKVQGHTLIWGTDLAYAGIHQDGDAAKSVPARPFLVIRDEWQRELAMYVVDRTIRILHDIARGKG